MPDGRFSGKQPRKVASLPSVETYRRMLVSTPGETSSNREPSMEIYKRVLSRNVADSSTQIICNTVDRLNVPHCKTKLSFCNHTGREIKVHLCEAQSTSDISQILRRVDALCETVVKPKGRLPIFGELYAKETIAYWKRVHRIGIPKTHKYIPNYNTRVEHVLFLSAVPGGVLVGLTGDPPNDGLAETIVQMGVEGKIAHNQAEREVASLTFARENGIYDIWTLHQSANLECAHCGKVHRKFLGAEVTKMCYLCTLQDCDKLEPIEDCWHTIPEVARYTCPDCRHKGVMVQNLPSLDPMDPAMGIGD